MLEILIQSFVDDRWLQIEDEIGAITPEMPLKEALLVIGKTMFHYIATDKNIMMILLREQNVLSEQYSSTFNHHIQAVINKTVFLLKEKAEKNEIRSLDYFMMANQFCSSIYIYILQNTLFGKNNFYRIPSEEYLKSVINYSMEVWKKNT